MDKMAKALVFDTGPIISLTLNNLLWTLKPLHEKFNGDFIIPKGVYKELVEKPLETKKYKFEAMQILPYIAEGIVKVVDSKKIEKRAKEILDKANRCFKAKGSWIKIVHQGEMEAIALCKLKGSKSLVIDERTTRMLIEEPENIRNYLEKKLHTRVEANENNILWIKKELSMIKVIRSFELAVVSYDLGLFKRYIAEGEKKIIKKDIKKLLLEGILWGIKLNGCSVKYDEIEKTVRAEVTD